MIPRAALLELFEYNYWARDRQLEACAQLTDEQFLKPLGNSFSSIRDTLAHMAGVEWLWLRRCRDNESPPALPPVAGFPSLATTEHYWRAIEREYKDYLEGLTGEALLAPVSYVGFTGERWNYPTWRVLLHVVNHQTYHRGQITMLLRLLGARPPAVDLLVAQDLGLFAEGRDTLAGKPASPIQSDVELARRLERAEATANARFVEARARLFPESRAGWIEVAGAYAMFDGARSPVTQTFGIGLFQTPTKADLQTLEAFFADRGAPVAHEVCPIGGAALLPLLNTRGYRPRELSNVMFLPLHRALPFGVEPDPAIRVRLAGGRDREQWAITAAEGWRELTEVADQLTDLMRVVAETENGLPFLAELDHRPIAAGALSIHEGVALLAGASTIPEHRRRGAHAALFRSRLEYASRAGCDVAMICTEPGSAAQRNAQRYGFQVAYTRTKWIIDAGARQEPVPHP